MTTCRVYSDMYTEKSGGSSGEQAEKRSTDCQKGERRGKYVTTCRAYSDMYTEKSGGSGGE